jgi:uncharacterized coiled-coil protein SlyX
MAEKRVIELEVKLGASKKAIDDLTKSTTDLSASFEDVYGEMQPLSGRMGELEDRLYELALAGKQNTQEYKDLQAEIAKFKKVIAETDASVDGASGTMSQKLGGALGGVTAGFELAQGAMGAFGVESQDVEAALLKVQSAMAISQGVQGIKEAIPSFKALGTAAKNALAGIRTGIAATGIGLLVVAVGTLVAYWDDIKSAISGVSAEQEALNAKSQKDVDLQKEKLESLDSQDNVLKLQGLTEKQILQLKIKQTDEAIKAYEISIKNQEQTLKAQIQAEKRNKEILKGILQFILAPINLLLKTVDEIGAFLGKDWNLQDQVMDWTASLIFDPKEVEEEGMKAIAESKKALAELKNQQAGFQLQVQAIDKQAADARRQAQKEANAKRIADEKEKNDKLKELAEDKAKFDLEQIELDEIRQEQAYKRKLDAAAKAAEEEKAQEDKYKAEQLAAEEADEKRQEDAYKRRLEGEEKLQELKYAAVLQGLTLISDLSEVFAKKGEKQAKRAFEIQKAASIAAAVITTYQSAVSAYQSQFLPLPDPTSPIRGAIAAGIAVAAGLGNVAKIASQKFEGGGSISASPTPSGGGGGGGATGGNVVAPNFNLVGNAQATNPLAGLGEGIIQAYVVSGDVTTAQSLDRNRVNNATFG